ncbi:hypothetical protein TSUD_342660 [Trifolium subterraneum]|nr:hypothetical protein TSUD_342660 [Trifolium subterraneum]
MELPNIEISNINTISNPDVEPKPKPILTGKRKSGRMSVLRVALLIMRGSPKKSNKIPIDDESKNIWSKFVGSIRPLHLQSIRSSRSFSGKKFNQPVSPSSESTEDASMFTAEEEPLSPLQKSPSNSRYASAVGLNNMVQKSPSNSRYASAVGLNEMVQSDANSRYASAVGLNELVPSDEEDEKEEAIEEEVGENGDEKIDVKADEFIAQFYQQMRMQRLNNVDRHYQERSERSLGC